MNLVHLLHIFKSYPQAEWTYYVTLNVHLNFILFQILYAEYIIVHFITIFYMQSIL